MIGYKGFDKNLKCREKQYKENTVFEEEKAEICENGMHFCKNPFDVWYYYPPCDKHGNLNKFATVEALDDPVTDDNKKYCTTKLKVGAVLSLGDFVKAGVDFILEKAKKDTKSNTGDYSVSTNTGNCSVSTNTGDRSVSTNTGYRSVSTNTGYRSVSTNTGSCSASIVEGNDSVAITTGYQGKAKGKKGCWLACVERNSNYEILDFKTVKVDGKIIKEDTFYMLKNGKFEEVADE